MTPKAYRACRVYLGLTRKGLARKLEVTPATIRLRETGKQRVRLEAELAIKYLVKNNRQ